MGVGGIRGGSQEDFRRGECRGVEGGVPDTRVKMKIDIVTRENKILKHDLNEKNPMHTSM